MALLNCRKCPGIARTTKPTPSDVQCWRATQFMNVNDIIWYLCIMSFQIMTLPKMQCNDPSSVDGHLMIYGCISNYTRGRKAHAIQQLFNSKNTEVLTFWENIHFQGYLPQWKGKVSHLNPNDSTENFNTACQDSHQILLKGEWLRHNAQQNWN